MKLRIGLFICTFLIPAMFVHGVVHADDTPVELDCLEEIGTDQSFQSKLSELFGDQQDKLSSEIIKSNAKDLYELIAQLLFQHCTDYIQWNSVADNTHFAFKFNFKDQEYHITLNTDALFKLHPVQTVILFAPKTLAGKIPGDLIVTGIATDPNKDMSPTEYFFDGKCSTHNIITATREGNTWAVNDVIRNLMSGDNKKYWYFIGLKEGAFPGLLLSQNGGFNLHYYPLSGTDYQHMRKATKYLAQQLSGTKCKELLLFQVSLNPDNIYVIQDGKNMRNNGSVLTLSEPFIIK